MMNRLPILFASLLLLLIAACDKKNAKQTPPKSAHPEAAVFATMQGRIHQVGRTEPYTGKITRHHPNGKLAEEAHYKAGRMEGLQTTWHTNGQLRSKLLYVNGAGEGLEEVWHLNGKMAAQSHYRAGILHGATTTWYSNGISRSRLGFKSGLKHGAAEAWYENGKASRKGEWSDGRPHGIMTEWYPNGQMLFTATYHLGKKNGVARGWRDDGKPSSEEVFKDDQPISKVVWTDDGKRQALQTKKTAKDRAWTTNQFRSYYLGQSDALIVETFGMPDSTADGWWNYEKMNISGSGDATLTNPPATNLYPILRFQFKQGTVAKIEFLK